MGCASSSESKPPPVSNQQRTAARTAPVAAAPVVPQQPPYLGLPCEYRFENFQIPYEVKTGLVFMPNTDMQISTLDTKVYIPTIASLYDLGYRLLSFSVFPGSMTASGFMTYNTKTIMKCQAICRKSRDDEAKYTLNVEKSVLPMQMYSYGMFQLGGEGAGNADHIFQTIFAASQRGARLVSIEITGGNAQNAQAAATAPLGGMGRGMGLGMGGMGGTMNAMSFSVFGFSAGMGKSLPNL